MNKKIIRIVCSAVLYTALCAVIAIISYRNGYEAHKVKRSSLTQSDVSSEDGVTSGVGTTIESVEASMYPEITPQTTSSFYYYNQLDNYDNAEEMKDLYNDLLDICWEYYNSTEDADAVLKSEGATDAENIYSYYIPKSLKANDYNLTDREMDIVEDALFHDMPLFYFLAFRIDWPEDENIIFTEYLIKEGDNIRISITNNISDNGISRYYDGERRQECKSIIEENVHKYYDMTKNCETAYEKQQIIFNGICMDSDYNDEALMASYAHTIIGGFEGRRLVCEGYTKSANLLLNYCGVTTIDISGVAGEEKHVWNAVKLDDNWYLTDLTFSDTTENYTISAVSCLWKENECNNYYVNVPSSTFAMTHIPWSSVQLPEFSDDDTYYDLYAIYIDNEIKNSHTDEEIQTMVYDAIKLELVNGDENISVWFDDKAYFDHLATLIYDKMDELLDEVYQKTGIRYKLIGGYNYCCNSVREKTNEAGEKFFVMDLAIPFGVAEEIGDYTIDSSYNIDGKQCVSITDVRMDAGEILSIPEELEGKPVIMYISGAGALEFRKIVLPDSMLVLYNGCFRYGKMTSVSLNEGLKTIDYGVFHDCLNLKSIYVPESVTTIASYALGYYYNGDVRTKMEDFIIYGYEGSTAQAYAEENGFEFVVVTEPPFTYGDINDDNKINILDAVLMKKYIAGYEELTINIGACDVNIDDKINVMDVVRLLKYIAGFDVMLGE